MNLEAEILLKEFSREIEKLPETNVEKERFLHCYTLAGDVAEVLRYEDNVDESQKEEFVSIAKKLMRIVRVDYEDVHNDDIIHAIEISSAYVGFFLQNEETINAQA